MARCSARLSRGLWERELLILASGDGLKTTGAKTSKHSLITLAHWTHPHMRTRTQASTSQQSTQEDNRRMRKHIIKSHYSFPHAISIWCCVYSLAEDWFYLNNNTLYMHRYIRAVKFIILFIFSGAETSSINIFAFFYCCSLIFCLNVKELIKYFSTCKTLFCMHITEQYKIQISDTRFLQARDASIWLLLSWYCLWFFRSEVLSILNRYQWSHFHTYLYTPLHGTRSESDKLMLESVVALKTVCHNWMNVTDFVIKFTEKLYFMSFSHILSNLLNKVSIGTDIDHAVSFLPLSLLMSLSLLHFY